MDTQGIGTRAREARKKAGLTQTVAAKEFRCAQSLVSQIENEETQPSIDYLAWLSERADVSVEWLITGKVPLPMPGPKPSITYPLGEEDKSAVVTAENLLRFRGLDTRFAVVEIHHPPPTSEQLSEEENRLLAAFRSLDRKFQEAMLVQIEMTAAGLKKSAKKEPQGGGLMEAI